MAIFKLKITSFSHDQHKSHKLFFLNSCSQLLPLLLFFCSSLLPPSARIQNVPKQGCWELLIPFYCFSNSVMDSFTEIQGLFFSLAFSTIHSLLLLLIIIISSSSSSNILSPHFCLRLPLI